MPPFEPACGTAGFGVRIVLFEFSVARPEGFEPPTPCSGGTCSIHLSYGRAATHSSLGAHSARVKAAARTVPRQVISRCVFRGFSRASASRSAARAVEIPSDFARAITSWVRS